MAIRSHVKLDNKSISLLRLLMQIRDCAGQFTFQFFLEQFPIDPAYVDWQPVTFAPFSDDGRSVSSKIVQRDIEILRTLTIQIEELADRTLAHLDKRGFDGKVTFGELDACVDAFDKLVCKYLKLTAGAGYATLEPTILCDWQKIFTVPLDIRNSGQSSGEWDE